MRKTILALTAVVSIVAAYAAFANNMGSTTTTTTTTNETLRQDCMKMHPNGTEAQINTCVMDKEKAAASTTK